MATWNFKSPTGNVIHIHNRTRAADVSPSDLLLTVESQRSDPLDITFDNMGKIVDTLDAIDSNAEATQFADVLLAIWKLSYHAEAILTALDVKERVERLCPEAAASVSDEELQVLVKVLMDTGVDRLADDSLLSTIVNKTIEKRQEAFPNGPNSSNVRTPESAVRGSNSFPCV